jgi:hypothetical protein
MKLEERLQQFQTLEDSLVLANLMQKGTAVLAEGTNLSVGMINKYMKFTNMQKTPLTSAIQPEKVREFITKMFDPPLDSDIPNIYQLLSFLEQDQYEDEATDGLWIPIKFAAPLSPLAINEAIDYLETYETTLDPIEEVEEIEEYASDEIAEDELEDLMGESNWLLTKSMIETAAIEAYFENHEEASVEQVVIEATSDQWSDAINALTAISALVGNKKITITKQEKNNPIYDKKWEWMKNEDGSELIRKRSRKGTIDEQSDK